MNNALPLQREIYCNRETNARKVYVKLENDTTISSTDKDDIRSFVEYLGTTTAKTLRQCKISSQLRAICHIKLKCGVENPLKSTNMTELVKIIGAINSDTTRSEATKADYRRAIKQFFKWCKRFDTRLYSNSEAVRMNTVQFYDYIAEDISISYRQTQADYSTIINEDDIAEVIEKGCYSLRDKAFVSLLHETGCRIGEFLNIKLEDIEEDSNLVRIKIQHGKTGKRTVYAFKSAYFLRTYIRTHPHSANKQAYLWVSESTNFKWQPINHAGAQKLVSRCFARSKINKKHNLHWFRHSRATLLAPKMNQQNLCKFMGWTQGSRQFKVYVHLCDGNVEDEIRQLNGIADASKTENARAKQCPICSHLNANSSNFCSQCLSPLDVSTAINSQDTINEQIDATMQTMLRVFKNPDMLASFEQFLKHKK